MRWGATSKAKYKNRKVHADGMVFDSEHEYRRWRELCLLERAGEIRQLRRQVKYALIPAQYEPDTVGPRGGVRKGKMIEREMSYVADFVYEQDGGLVVEDAKGFITPEYVIKRKLMLYLHGVRIREVRYGG